MFFNGQNEEAFELIKKGLEIDQNFDQSLGLMAQLYARKGICDQAISNWRKLLSLHINDIHKISAFMLGFTGQGFRVAGLQTEVVSFLNELNRRAEKGDYVPNTCFAFVYQE